MLGLGQCELQKENGPFWGHNKEQIPQPKHSNPKIRSNVLLKKYLSPVYKTTRCRNTFMKVQYWHTAKWLDSGMWGFPHFPFQHSEDTGHSHENSTLTFHAV
jgi:hypothetical protein